MARKCTAPGCGLYLPDKYQLLKCPWHIAPGRGSVKIAAALTIAAAGFGGGFAYKRFRRYLDERKLRKEREDSRQRQASVPEQQKSHIRFAQTERHSKAAAHAETIRDEVEAKIGWIGNQLETRPEWFQFHPGPADISSYV